MRMGVLAVGVVLSGCANLEDGAKDTFSQSFTCPRDRVEVRARKDLKPSSLLRAEAPPAEVAADPGRLQMWQTEHDKRRADEDQNGAEVFEARGCDKHALYTCRRSSRRADRAMCFSRDDPPGLAKW